MGKIYAQNGKIGNNEDGKFLRTLSSMLKGDNHIFYKPYLNGDSPDIIVINRYSGILVITINEFKEDEVEIYKDVLRLKNYKKNIINLHLPEIATLMLEEFKYSNIVRCLIYYKGTKTSEVKNLIKSRDIKAVGDDFKVDDIGFDKLTKVVFSEELYNKAAEIVRPCFKLCSNTIGYKLTKKQLQLSESRPGKQKVKGIAGAGKTIILVERAVNSYIRTKGKVLILTYNITLKNYILEKIAIALQLRGISPGAKAYFTVLNYHSFISAMANNTRIRIKNLETFDNTNLFQSVNNSLIKFDGIFIDEVQDFKYNWLRIIEKYFLKEKGEFVIYGDEKQNIYNRELEADKSPKTNVIGKWNFLNKSFRLSAKNLFLAKEFQNTFLNSKYNVDEIEVIPMTLEELNTITNYKFIDGMIIYNDICENIINLINENEIRENNVAIITHKIETAMELEHSLRNRFHLEVEMMHETKEELEKIKSTCKDDKQVEERCEEIRKSKKYNFTLNCGKIKISTIHSFKGWEIDTLIMIVEDNSYLTDEIIYTSLTRAVNNLLIFNIKNMRLDKFFRNVVGDIVTVS